MRFLSTILLLLSIGCNHPESAVYDRESSSAKLSSEKKGNSAPKNISDNTPISDPSSLYKVVGVKDGDTYVLLIDNTTFVVRSAHIDCPEKKQPYGQRAKQFAAALCFGKYVTLKQNNKYDRNHRLIAEVILEDGQNLNKLLVQNGLAWHFKKYSKDKDYAELEAQAQKSRIGLWADNKPIAPWIWRKKM